MVIFFILQCLIRKPKMKVKKAGFLKILKSIILLIILSYAMIIWEHIIEISICVMSPIILQISGRSRLPDLLNAAQHRFCACVHVCLFTVTLLEWNGYLVTITEHLHTPACFFFPPVADTENGTAVSKFSHSKSPFFLFMACDYMEQNCTFKLVEQKYKKTWENCKTMYLVTLINLDIFPIS